MLSFATASNRAVITQNRRDFIRLHQQGQTHAEIVVCSKNLDWDAFAAAIYQGLAEREAVEGELIRITKTRQSHDKSQWDLGFRETLDQS